MYQDSTTKRSSILKSLEPLRIGIVYLIESRATMAVERMGELNLISSLPPPTIPAAFINKYKTNFNISG